MEATLHFDSVDFRYGRGLPVLTNYTHAFTPGVVTWLRGSNGSGKTTLLRLAARLLRARKGTVRSSEPPTFVPSTVSFHEQLTLSEELSYLKALSPLPHGALEKQLSEWGVNELDPTCEMEELSTGWRQRLALSLASAAERKVVLLDEPFANLDDAGVLVLQNWIHHSISRGGIVVVAHHGSREQFAEVETEIVAL
jgi:ABC-type multidrug transport system ATPase subunit